MSCNEFCSELKPTRRLRRLPPICAAAALVIGAALILRFPWPLPLRALALATWLGFGVYELARFSRAAATVRRLRIGADGSVLALRRDGRWDAVQLRAGSIVLPRLAWLLLRLPDGQVYGELLSGEARSSPQWHRLQLIWRQGRGAFGRTWPS